MIRRCGTYARDVKHQGEIVAVCTEFLLISSGDRYPVRLDLSVPIRVLVWAEIVEQVSQSILDGSLFDRRQSCSSGHRGGFDDSATAHNHS